jgi:hypothetical protein
MRTPDSHDRHSVGTTQGTFRYVRPYAGKSPCFKWLYRVRQKNLWAKCIQQHDTEEVQRYCSVLERVNVFHIYGANNLGGVYIQGPAEKPNDF